MKIVYCIAGLYNSAGMERVITNKANYFAQKGHDVYVITAEQCNRPLYYPLLPSVKHVDLDVNYSQEETLLGKLTSVLFKRRSHKKKLTEVLNSIKADIVISTFGNEIFFLHKIKDGSKKVAEIHFCKNYRLKRGRKGLWYLVDWIRTLQENRHASKYDAFVTLTNEDKKNWNNNNVWAIPNAVYSIPDQFAKLHEKNLLVVGRFSYQKGYDRLIRIWQRVSSKVDGWYLSIYGDGEEKDSIKSLAESYGISDTINFNDAVKDISTAYLKSSALLLTSRYEGLPMVLLEAISYGLPLISFACPCGPMDIIEDGVNGFLIKDGDEEAFAEKLVEIIRNDELRIKMGVSAKQTSLKYSNESVMAQWEELFGVLISR